MWRRCPAACSGVVTILGRYLQDTATASSDVPGHTPGTGGPVGPGPRPGPRGAHQRRRVPAAAGHQQARVARRAVGQPAGPAPGRGSQLPWPPGGTCCTPTSPPAPKAAGPTTRPGRWPSPANRSTGPCSPSSPHWPSRSPATAPTSPSPPSRARPSHSDQRQALNAACHWLWVLTAARSRPPAAPAPVPAADRDLLAAIPVNALPARPSLAAAETVSGLCDGVTATAERLRHLAWHTARQPPWSPGADRDLSCARPPRPAPSPATTAPSSPTPWPPPPATAPLPATSADLAAAADAARQARGSLVPDRPRPAPGHHRHPRPPLPSRRRSPRPGPVDRAARLHRPHLDPGQRPPPPRPPTPGPGRPARRPARRSWPRCTTRPKPWPCSPTPNTTSSAPPVHAGRILVPTRTLPDDYNIPRPYAPALPRTHQHPARPLPRRHATPAARPPPRSAAPPHATDAPSRTLTTARAATSTTHSASPARDTLPRPRRARRPGARTRHARPPAAHPARPRHHQPQPCSPAAPTSTRPASACLSTPLTNCHPAHQRPPAATLNKTAATAALLNHALATSDPRAARLLRQPSPPESKDQEPELEPET